MPPWVAHAKPPGKQGPRCFCSLEDMEAPSINTAEYLDKSEQGVSTIIVSHDLCDFKIGWETQIVRDSDTAALLIEGPNTLWGVDLENITRAEHESNTHIWAESKRIHICWISCHFSCQFKLLLWTRFYFFLVSHFGCFPILVGIHFGRLPFFKFSIFCIYLLVMPKYWGKQSFSLGSFPDVGQKQ